MGTDADADAARDRRETTAAELVDDRAARSSAPLLMPDEEIGYLGV